MKPVRTKPCDNCPFRMDINFGLTDDRTREIYDSLHAGFSFPCHKTVEYDDEDGEGRVTSRARMCAGAANLLIAIDRPNQLMQVAKRLGYWKPSDQDTSIPTARSAKEFKDAQRRMKR